MSRGRDSIDKAAGTPPSQAVIEAVAEAEGVPPTTVSPPEYESLHAVADPTALDALFADRSNGASRPGGTVTFPFCGYDVTVERDGSVSLEERNERGN
ncbi:HalOD1 output domain-containing protein [Natrinema salinisoli]|uniref:HalOD1 output domain-containing protein n=1 Tax=Natrinema salinisoli TaxID=2878535 RepID=UPI001CF01EAF|nr:HalOD1 output domain-containing protein [Natrinema salinisoli]